MPCRRLPELSSGLCPRFGLWPFQVGGRARTKGLAQAISFTGRQGTALPHIGRRSRGGQRQVIVQSHLATGISLTRSTSCPSRITFQMRRVLRISDNGSASRNTRSARFPASIVPSSLSAPRI